MDVIVPCAGKSTRFPNLRPKYLLTDYSGKLMVENAVKNYLGKNKITIVILKEHIEKFNAFEVLRKAFREYPDVYTHVLEKPTNGPAETVYRCLVDLHFNDTEILIKDCDSFYDCEYQPGNSIHIAKISKNPTVRNLAGKSYVVADKKNIVYQIMEKQIVSDDFCVGGYQFKSSMSYSWQFNNIKSNSEIYISHVIDNMIQLGGSEFKTNEVSNFIDVGTSEDWFDYNNRPTYFCDIDGTIVKSSGGDYYAAMEPLQSNVDSLIREMRRGCKLIFCTARPKIYEVTTRALLDGLGFTSYDLIMDVHHAKRVLVNDYANSNPYPTAVAINLKRDSNNLEDMI